MGLTYNGKANGRVVDSNTAKQHPNSCIVLLPTNNPSDNVTNLVQKETNN